MFTQGSLAKEILESGDRKFLYVLLCVLRQFISSASVSSVDVPARLAHFCKVCREKVFYTANKCIISAWARSCRNQLIRPFSMSPLWGRKPALNLFRGLDVESKLASSLWAAGDHHRRSITSATLDNSVKLDQVPGLPTEGQEVGHQV